MKRQSGAGTIASLTLTIVFGVTLLLSLATGAGVYRNVADRVEKSANQRVGMSYITAKVHSYDGTLVTGFGPVRQISVGRLENGEDALFLTEDVDGDYYETILYVYDGYLRELMCMEGQEPGPEAGQPITEAQSLTVEEPMPQLLRIHYVDGNGVGQFFDIYQRSEG